jgi:hypothetical protein
MPAYSDDLHFPIVGASEIFFTPFWILPRHLFPHICTIRLVLPSSLNSDRLALVSKGAVTQTWSQVTQIDLEPDDVVPFPYDTIFQHTGSNLRAVTLSSPFHYPLILRHLMEHCPNLQSLSLTITVLKKFPSMKRRVAALLPRLTRFCVKDDFESERFLPSELFQIVEMCSSSLNNITELNLFCSPRDSESELLEPMLNKMPRLRRLRASIPSHIIHRIPILASLKFTGAILFQYSDNFEGESDILEFVGSLGASNIGSDVSFHWRGSQYSFAGLLLEFDLTEMRFLEILKSSGVTSKISIADVGLLLLTGCNNLDRFDSFLKLIRSNSHPLLPLRDELNPMACEILSRIIFHLPDPSIELFVDTFGAMKLKPSMMAPLLLAPARRRGLFERNLVSVEAIAHPESAKDNLFFFVNSKDQLEWLLTLVPKNDAMQLLRQRPLGLVAYPCPLLRFLPFYSMVDIIKERLEGLPIFAFPDPDEFLHAVLEAKNSLPVLKLIVNSTGIQNVSREVRGNLLWRLFAAPGFNPDAIQHWFELFASPLLADPPHFYVQGLFDALEISSGSLNRLRPLHNIFKTFETAFLHQLSEPPIDGDPDLDDVLSAFARWIIRVTTIIEMHADNSALIDSFSNSDIEFVIECIFTPVARICSERNKSPTCVLATIINRRHLPNEVSPIEERLFNICATFDLRGDVVHDRLESHLRFATFIVQNFFKLDYFLLQLTEKWLDKISPEAMNQRAPQSGFNVLDVILHTRVALLLTNLEDLVHRLVQRGCRISHLDRFGEYCSGFADMEALELYFEALRSTSSADAPRD